MDERLSCKLFARFCKETDDVWGNIMFFATDAEQAQINAWWENVIPSLKMEATLIGHVAIDMPKLRDRIVYELYYEEL